MEKVSKWSCLVILFFIYSFCFGSNFTKHKYHVTLNKAEQCILTNQIDSAEFFLNQIQDTTYSTYINFLKQHILKENIDYNHLHNFILTIQYRKEINPNLILEYNPLKSIKAPSSKAEPNHDYIFLVGDYLNTLADHGFLEHAAQVFENYNAYISHFSKNHELIRIAQFKINTYNGLLAYINRDLDKAEFFYKQNIELGKSYVKENKYNPLIEAYSTYLLVLQQKADIDTYIDICREIIDIRKIQIENGVIHHISPIFIRNLVDALIYQNTKTHKGNNLNEIKQLIELASKNTTKDYNTLLLYIHFFRVIEEHSVEAKRIFKLFNVDNLVELCEVTVQETKRSTTKLQLIQILNPIVSTLNAKGYYKDALGYSTQVIQLQKEIYTKDLSNQLAEHKALNEKNKRRYLENVLAAKTELDNYIFISLALIIIAIIIIGRIQFQKNKILKIKNEEKQFFIEEINHRIKNNFQIASAYLRIQFSAFRNQQIDQLIKQWNSKLKSIITVHQYLYQNDTLKINVKQYTNEIIQEVLKIYPEINWRLDVEVSSEYELYNNAAIKIGLILNELLTNSVKHGVKEDNTLYFQLEYTYLPELDKFQLKYSDSGIKQGFNLNKAMESSFGIRLIENLCSIIDGNLSYSEESQSLIIVFKDVT